VATATTIATTIPTLETATPRLPLNGTPAEIRAIRRRSSGPPLQWSALERHFYDSPSKSSGDEIPMSSPALDRQLVAYTLAGGAGMLAAGSADAAIIYSGLLNQAVALGSSPATDFNGGGDDLTFQLTQSGTGPFQAHSTTPSHSGVASRPHGGSYANDVPDALRTTRPSGHTLQAERSTAAASKAVLGWLAVLWKWRGEQSP